MTDLLRVNGHRGRVGRPHPPVSWPTAPPARQRKAPVTNDCDLCGRPQPDTARVCHRCTDTAYQALEDLAGAGGSTGIRPPLGPAALARLDAVTAKLATWTRVVAGDRGDPLPAGDPLKATASYLAARLGWIRQQQFAADAYRDFAAARRVVGGIARDPGRDAELPHRQDNTMATVTITIEQPDGSQSSQIWTVTEAWAAELQQSLWEPDTHVSAASRAADAIARVSAESVVVRRAPGRIEP